MSELLIGQSLVFGEANMPTREGEVVQKFEDIYNIPTPVVGMSVFVRETQKSYTVKSLKKENVGGKEVYTKVDEVICTEEAIEAIKTENVGRDAEISANKVKVNALTNSLNSEVTRAKAAEEALNDLINGEGSNAKYSTRFIGVFSNLSDLLAGLDSLVYNDSQEDKNLGSFRALLAQRIVEIKNVSLVRSGSSLVQVVSGPFEESNGSLSLSSTEYGIFSRIHDNTWSKWKSVFVTIEDVDKAVADEMAKLIDKAPDNLNTLKEIADWIEEHEDIAEGLIVGVQRNAEAITNEVTRAKAAEEANANAITTEVDKLKDGDTIVGQAREIHSRNGKNDSANFLVRTTAGSGTIGDGVATLKSVGGNIVKNLVDGTFASGWAQYGSNVTIDIANNVLHVVAGKALVGIGYALSGVTGAKYIIGCFIKANSGTAEIIFGTSIQKSTNSNEWKFVYSTGAFNSASAMYIRSKDDAADFYATKPILIKLTEMFGAGKEPTQAECDRLFGTMDALPQGLSIANPTVFKSTGFNQFNPEMVLVNRVIKTIDDEGNAIAPTIDDGDKTLAIIPCLPCKIGEGENNGYHIHGEFGNDIKVYLTPLNPKDVDGELYMHELSLSEKGTYVPQIKGYMIVEVPTTANLCAHFLWSEDCDKNAYEPYYESVVELPHIPEMSEYGLAGIQSSGTPACDEIDLVKGVYRKKIGCVDLGSLAWIKRPETSLAGYFNAYIYPSSQTNMHGIASEKYAYVGKNYSTIASFHDSNTASDNIFSFATTNNLIYLKATSYNDIASFQTAIRGVMLYYELAEPIEYPLPKINNNYTSSDYGVEQFDGAVPCNANNLYYKRSLAGETRNFLDKMYANAGKESSKDVADYITNGIEGNKELATNAPNLALRALFIAAGAEYNDSGADITKTAPWGETVTHKAGHYYLNGLGDITGEQMKEIYNAGRITSSTSIALYRHSKIRTNLASVLSGGEGGSPLYFNYIISNSKIEVFMGNKNNSKNYVSSMDAAFFNSSKISYIPCVLALNNLKDTAINNTFKGAVSLLLCKIENLKINLFWGDSPAIYKESVLHTITNATPTSAITITLHADAYARLKDDAEIVAALAAQPLVTLVSA